ncbi:MAG: ribosomal RNA small subunit methyltransferase A [Candidatus Aminicenantes bacterium RBG_13_62_12]|nr:MAG: ribosomal RNA small subunit methyltransferase A [Candidatus Aminicenantes bacterium RBG_13_62_12]
MIKTRRQILGQHFLHNRGILEKIVRAVDPGKNELVIEIGPGRGALTFSLAERAGRVVALERDGRLVPALRERAASNLEVIEADALRVSFQDIVDRHPGFEGRVKLAGNLPYSISSPLLFKVLERPELFSLCVFLLQKEFARRLCAQAGSKLFAPLSILVQNHFEARILFAVSPASFSPPPRVDSALVRLLKRKKPLAVPEDEAGYGLYLQAAFRQRRKTLWNNLAAAGFSRTSLQAAFLRLGLDSRLRAEALPAEGHARLFEVLSTTVPKRSNIP